MVERSSGGATGDTSGVPDAQDPLDAELAILIVDDSPLVCERLQAFLEALGGVRVVGQASCAPEGLDLIDRQQPDFVTLDLEMAGGDGLELLEAIERRGKGPEIVVLTNHTSPELHRLCLERGAAAFLDKSTDLDVLKRRVEERRDGKRNRRILLEPA